MNEDFPNKNSNMQSSEKRSPYFDCDQLVQGMKMIRFHDALNLACEFASQHLADYEPIYIIRDVVGRVSLVVDVPAEKLDNKDELSEGLHTKLDKFGPGPEQAVQSREDLLLPEEIFASSEKICLREKPVTYLVDRLMNNRDWLRSPLVVSPPLPTAVAFSLKGGVGRSTAIAAWAHNLAERGYKVLAADLDLEAPGLQDLLLLHESEPRRNRLPDYGIVDWLVEGRVGQADEVLFNDMLGTVDLPAGIPGEIHLLPAFGRETKDYIAKLGRAYLSIMDVNGTEYGFADAIYKLLETALSRAEPFDIALLDARAGLHDIGAAAVTRIGAHAFLFARNDAQTWSAYRHLLEHLHCSPAVEWGMPDNDLRWRMSMVGAMTGGSASELESLREHSYSVWQNLYDQEAEATPDTPGEADENMPHWPIPVYEVSELSGASFRDPGKVPSKGVLARAFKEFFDIAAQRVLPDSDREKYGK